MGTRLRFLIEPKRTAAFNMARDFYFLKKVEEDDSLPHIFSVYTFLHPCITVGRHQKNLDFLKKAEELSIEVARRPTGGRAVIHSPDDVTYSFIFREREGKAKSVSQAYEQIKPVLSKFLRELGIEADRNNHSFDSYTEKTLCFLSRQRSDLTVRGRKACGNAILKLRTVLLLQGTFHYDLNENFASLLFGSNTAEKLLKTTLLLKDVAPDTDIFKAAAIFENILLESGYEVERSQLTDEELNEIAKISQNFEVFNSCC